MCSPHLGDLIHSLKKVGEFTASVSLLVIPLVNSMVLPLVISYLHTNKYLAGGLISDEKLLVS